VQLVRRPNYNLPGLGFRPGGESKKLAIFYKSNEEEKRQIKTTYASEKQIVSAPLGNLK